jgi:hypothetical protein
MRQHDPMQTTGLRGGWFELEITGDRASVEAL